MRNLVLTFLGLVFGLWGVTGQVIEFPPGSSAASGGAVSGTVVNTNSAVTSGIPKFSGQTNLVAAVAGTDFVAPVTTITAGNGMSGGGDLSANRTVTWAPNLWTSATVGLGDSSQSSIAWTFNLSGATDPVITAGNNSLTISTPVTLGDSSAASLILSSALSGGADPTITFANSLTTISSDLTVGGNNLTLPNGGAFVQGNRGRITATADGQWVMRNNALANGSLTLSTLTLTPAAADTSYGTWSGHSVTGSGATTGIDLSGTWNTSGSPTFLKVNVTNTASGASALLIDAQASGVSQFKVAKNGAITLAGSGSGNGLNFPNSCQVYGSSITLWMVGNNSGYASIDANGLGLGSNYDTFIYRDSAAVMQLGVDAATATNQKLKAHDGSGTDKVGADLSVGPGNGTGTGKSGAFNVELAPFGTTGSSQNTPVKRFIVAPEITLTDAATSAFEIALPTLRTAGGVIKWTVEVSDGTDNQSYSGITVYSVANKAGVYTKQIVSDADDEAKAAAVGTLTGSWSILDGTNKVTLQFTPSGSLTETTYRLYFTIENNSRQAITLL